MSSKLATLTAENYLLKGQNESLSQSKKVIQEKINHNEKPIKNQLLHIQIVTTINHNLRSELMTFKNSTELSSFSEYARVDEMNDKFTSIREELDNMKKLIMRIVEWIKKKEYDSYYISNNLIHTIVYFPLDKI